MNYYRDGKHIVALVETEDQWHKWQNRSFLVLHTSFPEPQQPRWFAQQRGDLYVEQIRSDARAFVPGREKGLYLTCPPKQGDWIMRMYPRDNGIWEAVTEWAGLGQEEPKREVNCLVRFHLDLTAVQAERRSLLHKLWNMDNILSEVESL